MKKTILFTTAIIMASLIAINALSARQPAPDKAKYYQQMGITLGGFAGCRTVEDYQDLANRFHIIAGAEKDEWLPRYYEAHCYLLMTYVEGVSSQDMDLYLDKAKPIVEKMMDMVPEDPEALTLQAFWYTCRMVIDPVSRSANLQPLIAGSLAKALAIQPGHPRALFMRIANDMGTAEFFGSDTSPYCEQARELLANWDDYKLSSPIHPSWGKESVEGIVNSCGQ